MLLNDTFADIVSAKVQQNLTWEEIAKRMNVRYSQNVIDASHRGNLADSYIELAEALGYDVEIRLVMRHAKKKGDMNNEE